MDRLYDPALSFPMLIILQLNKTTIKTLLTNNSICNSITLANKITIHWRNINWGVLFCNFEATLPHLSNLIFSAAHIFFRTLPMIEMNKKTKSACLGINQVMMCREKKISKCNLFSSIQSCHNLEILSILMKTYTNTNTNVYIVDQNRELQAGLLMLMLALG